MFFLYCFIIIQKNKIDPFHPSNPTTGLTPLFNGWTEGTKKVKRMSEEEYDNKQESDYNISEDMINDEDIFFGEDEI